jgi:prolipoprotein diacylglyceryl transferase
MAPGLVLAQAIGRWGNWFNQELFGKPTDLPWGLEISLPHRPIGYEQFTTFQPTFLYESLYCLAIVGVLLLAEKKLPLKVGQTFALYVALYTFGRFWFENLRIDPAHDIGPLRLNAWVSILVFAFGVGWFWWLGRHEPPQRRPRPVGTTPTVTEPAAPETRVAGSSTPEESP